MVMRHLMRLPHPTPLIFYHPMHSNYTGFIAVPRTHQVHPLQSHLCTFLVTVLLPGFASPLENLHGLLPKSLLECHLIREVIPKTLFKIGTNLHPTISIYLSTPFSPSHSTPSDTLYILLVCLLSPPSRI